MNKQVLGGIDRCLACCRMAILSLSFSMLCGSYAYGAQGAGESGPGASAEHGMMMQQQANSRVVTGHVVDENGEGVIGATVKIKGQTGGSITDYDGNFTINGPTKAFTIEISYVGYATYTVEVPAGKNSVEVRMKPDDSILEEVVVVGYGTQKKETVTGAISMLQTKELTQSPQANVSNMLAGRMPGLLAVQRSGEPGADRKSVV